MMRNLLNATLSMVIQRYTQSKPEYAEHKLQRLQRVLLRIDAMVEEAEGRHIPSKAMLRQLELLRQGMYSGHYMLDIFKCRDHEGDEEINGGRVAALRPQFRATKRRLFFPVNKGKDKQQNTMLDVDSLRKLETVLDGLEMLMADMQEFSVLLGEYPRICRQPYNTYLILDKVMFGRQMEKETILNYLLQPDTVGDGNHDVLPIVGAPRIGKSTLVEHVCLDERVRRHFRLIIFFSSDNLRDENVATLKESGVIKHQDLPDSSQGIRSLAVIELTGEIEDETWRRLYSSGARSMGHGSKIIITSRSEKIVALGTTQALRLKPLPKDAFWYFFKTLAFGSTDPDDQPKLKSLGREIAVLLNSVFLRAYSVASMLRTNQNAQYWNRVLQSLRDYTNRHVCTFGEHPSDLVSKSKPVYLWTLGKRQNVIKIYGFYQKACLYDGVPNLRGQDVVAGCAVNNGKFDMLMWRCSMPPYYAYVACCISTPARGSTGNKKRPRCVAGDMNLWLQCIVINVLYCTVL